MIDLIKMKVKAGDGGKGAVAFRHEKYYPNGGPFGGDGGRGGNVYFEVDTNETTLIKLRYTKSVKAGNGSNGMTKKMHGKDGDDVILRVPLGTMIRNAENGDLIADLTRPHQVALVARGGRGGLGNMHFATARNNTPEFAQPGEIGQSFELQIELRLLADAGIIGFPSVGKSTFLSVVSNAKPAIADYPFTTIVPNLGVVRKPNGDGYVVADIPGLIEGASEGIGLGHEFLRHVERCRFLIHLVDLTQEDPIKNYKLINEELKKHSEQLAKVYQVIALNKIDSVDEELQQKYYEEFKKIADDVFLISAVTRKNLDEFMYFVAQKVDEIPKPVIEIEVEEDDGATDNDDSAYSVYKVDKHMFVVEGGKIFRLANVTDGRNTEQLYRFQNILKSMGVFDALKAAGVQEGDTVKIGHLEFDYLF